MKNKKMFFIVIYFLSLDVWAESSLSQRYSCAMSLLPQSRGLAVAIGELLVLPSKKNILVTKNGVLPEGNEVYVYSDKTAYQCIPDPKKVTMECVVAKLNVDGKTVYAYIDENFRLNDFSDASGLSRQLIDNKRKNCKSKKVKYLEVECKNKLDTDSKDLLMGELKNRVKSTVRTYEESYALLDRETQIREKRKPNTDEENAHRSFFVSALQDCKPVVELGNSIDKTLSAIGHNNKNSKMSSQTSGAIR